jgi:hypothetical protein
VEKGLNVGERGNRRGKWKGELEEEGVKGKRQSSNNGKVEEGRRKG